MKTMTIRTFKGLIPLGVHAVK